VNPLRPLIYSYGKRKLARQLPAVLAEKNAEVCSWRLSRSIFVLTERHPCVASTLAATHCLVISRLGKGDQDHAYINLLTVRYQPEHISRNWHRPAIRIRPLNLCLRNTPCMSQQCLPTHCINQTCPSCKLCIFLPPFLFPFSHFFLETNRSKPLFGEELSSF
jgi:hypothetical protein